MSGIGPFLRAIGLAAALVVPGGGAAMAAGPGGLSQFDAICSHFENRARFKPRVAEAEAIVHFAASCRIALDRLAEGDPAQAEAALARRYLDRLAEFQRLTVYMLMQHMWADPSADTGLAGRAHRQMGLSSTGEYLIARYMGLIGAYDDWAAETGFELTASR
jgi:hypothetical protein